MAQSRMTIQFHYIDWYKDKIKELKENEKNFPSLINQLCFENQPINPESLYFNIIPNQIGDIRQFPDDYDFEKANSDKLIENIFMKCQKPDLVKAESIEESVECNFQFIRNIDIETCIDISDSFISGIILSSSPHQDLYVEEGYPEINEYDIFLTYSYNRGENFSAKRLDEIFSYESELNIHLKELDNILPLNLSENTEMDFTFQIMNFDSKELDYEPLNEVNDLIEIEEPIERLEILNLPKQNDLEEVEYEDKNDLSTIECPALPITSLDMNSFPFEIKETRIDNKFEEIIESDGSMFEESEKFINEVWQKESIHRDPSIQSIPQCSFDLYRSPYDDEKYSLMKDIIKKYSKEVPLMKIELRLPSIPSFEKTPHLYYKELVKPDLFYRPQKVNETFIYTSLSNSNILKEEKLLNNELLWEDIKSNDLIFIDPFSTFSNCNEAVEFYQYVLSTEFKEIFQEESPTSDEINQYYSESPIEETVYDSLADFMRTRGVNKAKQVIYLKYPNLDNMSQDIASRSIGKSCLFICPSVSHVMTIFLHMIVELYYDAKLTKVLLYCENDNRIENIFQFLINSFKIELSKNNIISMLKSNDMISIPKETRILISSPHRLTSIFEWINYKEVHIFIMCEENSSQFPSSFLLPCNNLVVTLKSKNIVHSIYTAHKPIIHNYSDLRIYLEYLSIQKVVCIPSSYVPEVIPNILYIDLSEPVKRLADLVYEYIEGMIEYVDGIKEFEDHNKLKLAISSIISKVQTVSDEDDKNELYYSLKKYLSFHTLKRVYENLLNEGIDAAKSYMKGAIKQYSHFISDVMEDLNTAFDLSVAEINAGLYYAHPKIPLISSLIQDETKKTKKMNLKTLVVIEKGPNRIMESLKKAMPSKTISILDDFTEEMISYILRNTDIVIVTYNSITNNLGNNNMKKIFINNFELIIEWKNMNLVITCDRFKTEQKHIKLIVNDPHNNSISQEVEFNSLIESLRTTFSLTTVPDHHFIIDFDSIQKFSLQNPDKKIIIEDKKFDYIQHENTMIHVLLSESMFSELIILKSLKNANIIPHSAPLQYEQIILDENHCIIYQENISEEEMTKTIYNASYLSYKYKKALILLLLDENEYKECNILLARFCTKILHLSRKEGTCRFIIRILSSPNQIGECILKFAKDISSTYGISLEEWSSNNSPFMLRASNPSISSNFLSHLPYCDPFRSQIIMKKTPTLGHLLQMKRNSLINILSERIPVKNIEPLLDCFEHKIVTSKFFKDRQGRPKRYRENNFVELNPKRRLINSSS